MLRRSLTIAAAFLALAAPPLCAQGVPADTLSGGMPPWSYHAAAYLYLVDNEDDFLTAVLWADHGRLHQEARYNYEDLETASLWVGANFDGGSSIAWELTAMAGAVFGATDGFAPGFRGALYWNAFDLSSEGEYLFDSGNREDDFFYSWSELAWSRDWFRGGVAAQRTRVYHTDAEVQRGILVGGSWSRVDAAVYLFEPGSDAAALMLLAEISL